MQRKISIPSTFASICWFSSLFAILFFSFLYLHPRDTNSCLNTLSINASSKTSVVDVQMSDLDIIESATDNDNGLSSEVHVHLTTPPPPPRPAYNKNVSDNVQVLDLDIIESSHDIEVTRKDDIELVEKAPPTNKEEETKDEDEEVSVVAPIEQEQEQPLVNGTIIELVEKAPPTTKEEDVEVDGDVDEDKDENYDIIPKLDVHSNPPWNCSREERILWLQQKLQESKIIKSTSRTRNFDKKIQSFFNKEGCTERIFFTWISPASLFGKRELLVLESVFKAHPKGCVTILSRTMDSKPGRSTLQPFLDRGYRVFPIAPDFRSLFNNTPAQGWLERLEAGDVDPGSVPITQNLSNILRMVVLYKYGGVYLDTDMLILKSFSTLRNAIGIQSVDDKTRTWRTLNNAILIFDKGHPLVWKFMEEFAFTFDGFKWGFNGPYLTTRVVSQAINDTRYQFNFMSPMAFYPVDWIRIPRLFEKPYKNGTTWATTKFKEIDSESYGVHLWNKFTRRLKIEKRSAMGQLVSEHCIICQDVYDS